MEFIWNAIAAAAIGALLGILTRRILDRLRRPKLEIAFEEFEGRKPYVHSFALADARSVPKGVEQERALFFRLVVRNRGRSPALNCLAHMTVFKGGQKEAITPTLHWYKHDPIMTASEEAYPKPIHIPPKEEEILDVFMLNYKTLNGEPVTTDKVFLSMSPQPYKFQPQERYQVSITVEGANVVSKPFVMQVMWYGTFEAFDDGRFVTRLS